VTSVPLAPGILTDDLDEPALLGARCPACGVVTFPAQSSCPRCAGEGLSVAPLARRGSLWTWTVQRFPPKSSPYHRSETEETFEPYAVGYVELAGEVRVEARLVGVPFDELRIGMEMELTVAVLRTGDDGRDVVVPAFRPVAAGSE
jgi:uncharacterized OB-fold protein